MSWLSGGGSGGTAVVFLRGGQQYRHGHQVISGLLLAHGSFDGFAYPGASGHAPGTCESARVVENGGGQPGVEPGHRTGGRRALVTLPRSGFHLPGDVVSLVVVGRLLALAVICHGHCAFSLNTRRSASVMGRAVTACQRPSPEPVRTASR